MGVSAIVDVILILLFTLSSLLFLLLLRIDPTGEFSKQQQSYLWFWSRPKSSADIIKKELMYVREETKKKADKLQYASDVQTGMEILHYFILDLLGRYLTLSFWPYLIFFFFSSSLWCRDTPVARIFLTKTEEE